MFYAKYTIFLSVTHTCCKISPRPSFPFNSIVLLCTRFSFYIGTLSIFSTAFMTLKVLPYLQSIQLLTLFSPSFHSFFFFMCVYVIHSVVSDSLQPRGLQHARFPCPSLSPWVCSNSCPLGQWCYLTIPSSATPFSFCFQSFSASGSFLMCWPFTSSGQSTVASASVLPMNIQGWFPLELTGLISLLSKGF